MKQKPDSLRGLRRKLLLLNKTDMWLGAQNGAVTKHLLRNQELMLEKKTGA
jgi:hypothetical protein